jgi:hypothetical protein
VDHAIVDRMNLWLLVALVVALVLLASAVLITSQSGLLHMIGGMLQGPQQMAPWGCNGGPMPC